MHIRPYTNADLAAVAQLFTDAVHGLDHGKAPELRTAQFDVLLFSHRKALAREKRPAQQAGLGVKLGHTEFAQRGLGTAEQLRSHASACRQG